ncbi:MAG: N-formylglutamate amidohydrolase [Anaerolineales bacterium]
MGWQLHLGDEAAPLLAVALHAGHAVRAALAGLFALSAEERLREEDPFTGDWARRFDNWLIGTQSRFEIDLNRMREKAVYIHPADAWGLEVWKEAPPPPEVITESHAVYDAFYGNLVAVVDDLVARHGRLVVYDLHSYNHRREGPNGPPADPQANPQLNLGTGTMPNRDRWAGVIAAFMAHMRTVTVAGEALDVRENIKFQGGNMARWLHTRHPEAVCVLSIEFKKFFMDEWTGAPHPEIVATLGAALESSVPGVLGALKRA